MNYLVSVVKNQYSKCEDFPFCFHETGSNFNLEEGDLQNTSHEFIGRIDCLHEETKLRIAEASVRHVNSDFCFCLFD